MILIVMLLCKRGIHLPIETCDRDVRTLVQILQFRCIVLCIHYNYMSVVEEICTTVSVASSHETRTTRLQGVMGIDYNIIARVFKLSSLFIGEIHLL